MPGGWEHLAKEERLREMGFITLSGTGEVGARLLRRWVLGGGDATRLNRKRGGSGWIEQKILPGVRWALDQGSERWWDLSLWRLSRIGWTKPCTTWSEFGIYPAVSRRSDWRPPKVHHSPNDPVLCLLLPNLVFPWEGLSKLALTYFFIPDI